MISSVSYTSAGSSVVITTNDGTVWHDDASLPADTDIRRQLAEWVAMGNTISAYIEPEPTLDEKIAALDAGFAVKLARFNTQFVEASFANGSNENARIAELRQERDQALTDYADAVMTLMME